MNKFKFNFKFLFFVANLLIIFSCLAQEQIQSNPSSSVKWGGYIDTYYTWDFNSPDKGERAYATQAVRHSEFNVNLAHLEAVYEKDKIRGRLALQAGTYVQNNYSAEPIRGATSGPLLSRNIQEAYISYQFLPQLTAQMGIYFTHIGMESLFTQNNWVYTQSVPSEFMPYYQSGLGLTYHPHSQWSFQLHLLNGWQNIAESNKNKAVGAQVSFSPNQKFNITYNNFYGEDPKARFFQDMFIKYLWHPRFENAIQVDLGLQTDAFANRHQWYGFIYSQRIHLSEKWKLGTRFDHYHDPYQLNVATSTSRGFQIWGASSNIDFIPRPNFYIRTEFRYLRAKDPIYPRGDKLVDNDTFLVESFSLKF